MNEKYVLIKPFTCQYGTIPQGSEIICFRGDDYPKIRLDEGERVFYLDKEDVKKFLCKNGFLIENEEFVRDKRFIYQIIIFKKGKRKYTKKECPNNRCRRCYKNFTLNIKKFNE